MDTKRARTPKNQRAILNKINYNVAGIDLSSEDVIHALKGNYRAEYLFGIKQALEM